MKRLFTQIKSIRNAFKLSGKSGGISILDIEIVHLLKIRVSQLNNCLHSVNYHISNAVKTGLEKKKLDALPTWRNSELFSFKEKAALGIAEELVFMAENEVDGRVFQWASQYFSDEQLQYIVFQISKVNYWNRIISGTAILYGSIVILAENYKGLFQSPYYHK